MSKVLVTGATGNIGAHVVDILQKRGVPLRGFSRDAAAAARKLGQGIEIARGDFTDRESIVRALSGSDLVLLSSSNHPEQAAHEAAVIDAAAAARVKRIVKLSTVSAQVGSVSAFFDAHGRAEQYLRASGVPAVILQSSFYMSNLFAAAEPVRMMGKIFAPAGTARLAMIDPRDVAEVAVTVLLTERYDGQTLHLSGSEAITYADIARVLSEITGRAVDYVPVPDEVARQNMAASGMPEWFVDQIIRLYGLLRQGVAERVTGTVREVLSREPRTFTDFAGDNAAAFRAAEASTLTG